MQYWLIKSEGNCYSIDDLRRDGKVPWSGVRNFQARNYMRDKMKIGDLALFYHSSSKDNGVYGIAKVSSLPYEDLTARDPDDEHFDPRYKKLFDDAKLLKKEFIPVWVLVDFAFVKKLKNPVSLRVIKNKPRLKNMLVCKKGNRLSIQPVTKGDFEYIVRLATI